MRIAINGFGRIGRLTFRYLFEKGADVVAINDLTEPKVLAHLLKHDSAYGLFPKKVSFNKSYLFVGNKKIRVFSEKEPSKLPWKKLKIDVVLECTGRFLTYKLAEKHLKAGAKKVVLSARPKDSSIPQYNIGVNADRYAGEKIVSNASCTTNSITPVLKLIHLEYGIEKIFFSTIHAYTANQKLVDSSHKDLRRARAAGVNIIPTTTGAVKAVEDIFPDLKGKVFGKAIRVPVLTGSLTDICFFVSKETTKEEVLSFLRKKCQKLKGVVEFSEEPLVSTDIIGNTHSAIIDSKLTEVDGKTINLFIWYDNEAGYSKRLAELCFIVGKRK